MKRICVHQPDFLPHLGFFERLVDCDVYVVLDDVQFIRRGWQHRDRIKTRRGWAWLTLPLKKGDVRQEIRDVLLHPDRDEWVEGHLNLLRENYRTAPYFAGFFDQLAVIYRSGIPGLRDFNLRFLRYIFAEWDIRAKVVLSSSLDVAGTRSEKLRNLVSAVGGDVYVTGTGSLDYLDRNLFEQSGIAVEFRKFEAPVYPQLHGPFIPGLSCVDALLNCGSETKNLLRECRAKILA
jgi:hypothetical protein